MKEQYILYLLLENWATYDHIFYVIDAWLLASAENVKNVATKFLLLFVTMQHCVNRIEHFVTSHSWGYIWLFLSQKNFVEIFCCFRVAITFLHQPSNLIYSPPSFSLCCRAPRSTQSASTSHNEWRGFSERGFPLFAFSANNKQKFAEMVVRISTSFFGRFLPRKDFWINWPLWMS